MDKIKVSNRINRTLGGTELLFCTRVYIHSKIHGSFWIPLRVIIDFGFYILRGKREHCRQSYLYERRKHETKIEALQKADKAP